MAAGRVLDSGAELVMLDDTAVAAGDAELDVPEEEMAVLLEGSSEEETTDEVAESVADGETL